MSEPKIEFACASENNFPPILFMLLCFFLANSHSSTEKLNNLLKCEQQKSESQRKSFEASQQSLETLTERVASLEKKNSELSVQNDKLSKVTQDSMSAKKCASDLRIELELKERELEKERANRVTVEHSQSELLKKIKELQQENDELVVKLEGLTKENEGLITKNKRLEEQCKSNKVQLQKVNDTLKVPTATSPQQHQQQSKPQTPTSTLTPTSTPSVSDAGSFSATQKVTISTPEKIFITTAAAIPHSSPMSVVSSTKSPTTARTDATAAFADLFSRSISKDDDDVSSCDAQLDATCEQFDTKTYSIDQVSDTSLSELVEDDDEIDTVSYAK